MALNGTGPSSSVIPVIDFSGFEKSTDGKATAEEIVQAFKDVGFVYLKNHGVPQEDIDEAFSWSKKFFALPESTKQLAPHPPEGWWHRGYSGVGLEKVSHFVFDDDSLSKLRQVPDVKESYEMGKDPNPAMPNIWLPEEILPGFKAFFMRFYYVMHDLELRVLKALAVGLGLEEDALTQYHVHADNQTRLLHYPPIKEEFLTRGEMERIAAHSDFGTITFLFQDEVGGLEVEDPEKPGEFIEAPCIPGTVIVNLGDFMQRWSNDILKSTKHRVRAPPAKKGTKTEDGERMTPARYSIPYFCGADVDRVCDCLEGCYGPDNPKKYEAVSVGEYINMRMNALYSAA